MPLAILLDTLIALFKHNRWLLIAMPLLIALGLSHCSDRRHTKQRDEARAQLAKVEAASQVNLELAIRQNKQVEALSAQLAKVRNNAHTETRADARTSLAGYSGRMRLDKVCGSNPATATEGNNPGVSADLPAHSDLVAISETDLQALVDWLAYGVEAHNNAIDKLNAGRAIPEVEFGPSPR